MAENFNANFYVTCATVIPVLFLAAAVQGQAFVFVLQRARRTTGRQRERATLRFLRSRAVAIVIAGLIGEPVALVALYRESEWPGQRLTVMVVTLILVLAVAAAPISAYADRVANLLALTPEGPPEATGEQGGESPQHGGGNSGQGST